jgi:hypothetical protein
MAQSSLASHLAALQRRSSDAAWEASAVNPSRTRAPVNERRAHASDRIRDESVPCAVEQDKVQGVAVIARAHPALEVRQLVAERFADERRVQVHRKKKNTARGVS